MNLPVGYIDPERKHIRGVGLAAVTSVVVALAMLGGCGTKSGNKPVSKASFISIADARCMSDNAAAVSIDLSDLGRTSAMLKQTIAARIQLEKDLKSMASPRADRAALSAFFDAYDRNLAALKDLRAAAAKGDIDLTTQLAVRQAEGMKDMEREAAAYGFSFCGRF